MVDGHGERIETYEFQEVRGVGRLRENRLQRKWEHGEPALGCWLTVPSSFSAEILAHAGFDWLCVDLQHGVIDYAQMVGMLQGMSSIDVAPLVRVPWNEPGIIGKCLDAGAYGVIVPMVNTREEAEAAVRACRYAPGGVQLRPVARRLLGRARLLQQRQHRRPLHHHDRDGSGRR